MKTFVCLLAVGLTLVASEPAKEKWEHERNEHGQWNDHNGVRPEFNNSGSAEARTKAIEAFVQTLEAQGCMVHIMPNCDRGKNRHARSTDEPSAQDKERSFIAMPSYGTPTYVPGPTYVSAPAPTYIAAPAPTYVAAPAPTYVSAPAPAPSYSYAPQPTYSAPAPTYTYPAPAPAPAYTYPAPAPAPTYTYAAPAPSYTTYAAPVPVYSYAPSYPSFIPEGPPNLKLDPYFAYSLLGHREYKRKQYYDDYDRYNGYDNRYNNGYNRPYNGNPSVNIRPDMPSGGGSPTIVPIGDQIVGLAQNQPGPIVNVI